MGPQRHGPSAVALPAPPYETGLSLFSALHHPCAFILHVYPISNINLGEMLNGETTL